MMGDLRVELYGTHVGDLVGTNGRSFDFRTSRDAFATFSLGSTILSESVPLEAVQNRGRAGRRRNYFAELLPEGDLKKYLSDQAGLQESDTIGMLSRYGRDVAGALQIWDPDNPGEPRNPFAVDVDEDDIAEMLSNVRRYPLGNTKESGKSLINGVQAKIVLARNGERWQRPGDGYASTYILKPQLDPQSSVIFDEEYGARIARSLGLAQHDTHIEQFGGINTLVVERYDRAASSPEGRIHQEDMNQALGASGNEKYQKFGGKLSLKRIAEVFTKVGDTASAMRLAQLNVAAVALGNLDMHGKNVSLLHPYEERARLAPAYDVVPMAHLDNDHELALAVNGKYSHAEITADDIISETESWGLRGARELIMDTLVQTREALRNETPSDGAYEGLHDDLTRFTANLIDGRAAGDRRSTRP